MALSLPKLTNIPYKLIIIIILIYFLYSVLKEGFSSQTPFNKALDRMNPLAASQNPLKPMIPIGISEEDGVKARMMNQVALNNFNT
jgi:hypothetical protein